MPLMTDVVTYQLDGPVATVTMDDGKVNALSLDMFAALSRALDDAERDGAAVVLRGRPGAFSAGFDLRVLTAGGAGARTLVQTGFELAERMLGFGAPLVIACTGHALAMGSFLLLAGDERIGASGAFKIQANEVAIGITMPAFGVEMSRQRLTPAHFHRAVINAEAFDPDGAVAAGFLDRVVAASDLDACAAARAAELAAFNRTAFAGTKRRARANALRAVRAAIEYDAGNSFALA